VKFLGEMCVLSLIYSYEQCFILNQCRI